MYLGGHEEQKHNPGLASRDRVGWLKRQPVAVIVSGHRHRRHRDKVSGRPNRGEGS
jgi:hypothetical protein